LNETSFHPAVCTAIEYFADPGLSLQQIAERRGISRQAVHKQVDQVRKFLQGYGQPPPRPPQTAEIEHLRDELGRRDQLVADLRRQLIIKTALLCLANWLVERIQKFFPKFTLNRFEPYEKKQLLDLAASFQRAGGTLTAFCKAIGKTPATLARWRELYEKYGIGGLKDKTTRPHHCGGRIPIWLKEQILMLFRRFPQ